MFQLAVIRLFETQNNILLTLPCYTSVTQARPVLFPTLSYLAGSGSSPSLVLTFFEYQ
ncbi:hypothetical protein STRCR_2168 [Streptococcus criceti HS-6]|uniref:Uncharacterized protein n=1 Tax=Streptococcus criceti HS-6 TaxID=873449 RepID=G5JSG9_STRCG|nr:hypothetical protein STRCR_2168 [Streptococcus criceti HS-6]